MFNVYSGLRIYLFIRENHLLDRLSPITRNMFDVSAGRAAKMAPEMLDTLDWVQIFDIASQNLKTYPAVDEATRSIKHMMTSKEVSIWVTMAVQMFLDVKTVVEEEDALTAPFKEYQASVRKATSQFSQVDHVKRPFLEYPRTTEKISSFHGNMRNTLKDHRKIPLDNRWGEWLRKNKLKTHPVLG
jgi:hypothetical protein